MKMSKGQMGRQLLGLAVAGMALVAGGTASAELGQPAPWEWTLQESASPVMDYIIWFHNWLFVTITLITLFVLGLLAYVTVRFRAGRNPVPSRTTHNTPIEVIWTVLPVLILVVVAIPSFRLLYAQDRVPPPDITIKATGLQWYWNYTYTDKGNFSYDSMMVEDSDLKPGQPRLLATDRELVVPVGATVKVLVTAADVIHSFAVPAFGIKIDAVPGRLNETWFRVDKAGTYYGECSELCGARHALMPIEVRAVPQAEFDTWLAEQQKNAQADRGEATRMAASTNLQ